MSGDTKKSSSTGQQNAEDVIRAGLNSSLQLKLAPKVEVVIRHIERQLS